MLCSGRLLLFVLLASGPAFPALLEAGPIEAAEPNVVDRAGFFSNPAVVQAKQKIQEIHRRFKVDIVIETFPSIPDNMQAAYRSADKNLLSPLGRDPRNRPRRQRHLRADLQEPRVPANRTRSVGPQEGIHLR